MTGWAHDHRIATDYHINENPMLDQSDHFKHLDDNPTYIGREDWSSVDELVDWIAGKNQLGYQMVNSVPRLLEVKKFLRMSSGCDLHEIAWNGHGTGSTDELDEVVASTPGLACDEDGNLRFADWGCRAGQNNVVIRTDGSVAPCFPLTGNVQRGQRRSLQFRSRTQLEGAQITQFVRDRPRTQLWGLERSDSAQWHMQTLADVGRVGAFSNEARRLDLPT